MIVNLIKRDAMVMLFVLDVMKNNISSNLRGNHGIIKGKKMMKTYKSIMKSLEEPLINNELNSGTDESILDFRFTEEQSEMTREFLATYMGLIEDQVENEGKEIGKHPWYPSLRNCVYAFLIAEKEEVAV